jgi:hypothetical protein
VTPSRRRASEASLPPERGQASVELLAGALPLALLAVVGLQLLAFGYGAAMADHAAEAAAIAVAAGGDPARAAGEAVPGWPRGAIRVRRSGGRVVVTLAVPSPLGFLRGRLAARAEAAVPNAGVPPARA